MRQKKFVSTEEECTFDVTLRVTRFGKPDKLRAELKQRLEREAQLQLGNAEVRRIARARKP